MDNTNLYASEIKTELSVEKIVNRIVFSGKMSRQDHKLLTSIIFSDGKISAAERRQFSRIFDYIQAGSIQLVNW